jgi:hypothetical protein
VRVWARHAAAVGMLRNVTHWNFQLMALRTLTLNNLGCCHRQWGRLKRALMYLSQASEIGVCLVDHAKRKQLCANAGVASSIMQDEGVRLEAPPPLNSLNLSLTHLNKCAVLSQMNRHSQALRHAKEAVAFCRKEILELQHLQAKFDGVGGSTSVGAATLGEFVRYALQGNFCGENCRNRGGFARSRASSCSHFVCFVLFYNLFFNRHIFLPKETTQRHS